MSMAIKYAMKKKKHKGVHAGSNEKSGESPTGDLMREAKEKKLQAADLMDDAKLEHLEKLSELKSMRGQDRKYLADGGDIKGVHKSEYEEDKDSGRSVAGSHLYKSKKGSDKKVYEESAKHLHEKALKELKSMRHQNRKYLAEGGELDCYEDGGDVPETTPTPTPKPTPKPTPTVNPNAAKTMSKSFMESGKPGSQSWSGALDRILGKAEGGEIENLDMDAASMDMIDHIMKSRAKRYSEGGKVANDIDPITGSMPNEFDDLVLRDDLEMHETGAEAGDDLGNEREDHDRRDVVSAIMKSRKKKDKMPHPA